VEGVEGVVGVEAEVDEVERDSHLVWNLFRLYIECILVLGPMDVCFRDSCNYSAPGFVTTSKP
jgi:hypothetical protein